jgi:hypothetical protein
MGLSHGNNTAALPPMLLGDFETAKRAQNAVMASYACGFALAALRQPHPPQLAEHWHGGARRTKKARHQFTMTCFLPKNYYLSESLGFVAVFVAEIDGSSSGAVPSAAVPSLAD